MGSFVNSQRNTTVGNSQTKADTVVTRPPIFQARFSTSPDLNPADGTRGLPMRERTFPVGSFTMPITYVYRPTGSEAQHLRVRFFIPNVLSWLALTSFVPVEFEKRSWLI